MGRLFRYGDIIKVAQNPYVFAWVNQVIANGGTVTDAEKAAVRTFVESIDISEFDRLWVFGLGNEIAAKTSIVNPSSTMITGVNGITFISGTGFLSNGVTQYLNTNYQPSTQGVKFTVDSQGFGGYLQSNVPGEYALLGGGSGASSYSGMLPRKLLDKNYCDSSNGSSIIHDNSDSSGLISAERRNSTLVNVYRNGVLLLNPSVPVYGSVTIANLDMYILAYNISNSPFFINPNTVSGCYFSSGSFSQSGFNTAFQTLATTLGFNV